VGDKDLKKKYPKYYNMMKRNILQDLLEEDKKKAELKNKEGEDSFCSDSSKSDFEFNDDDRTPMTNRIKMSSTMKIKKLGLH
jgi:hypothetical protein